MVFDVQGFVGAMPFRKVLPTVRWACLRPLPKIYAGFLGREEYLKAFRKVTE